MSCESLCPLSERCRRIMVEAQKSTQEVDEVTQGELGKYDSMRQEGFEYIQVDMDEAQDDPSMDDGEKRDVVDELFAEVDAINVAVDNAKEELIELSKSRSLGRLARTTSEIREKEMSEHATCPGPKEVTNYSYMGKIVTHECRSKLRQKRVKKAKV